MDGTHFDPVMKTLATTPLTRGQTLRGLSAGMVASLTGLRLVDEEADAKQSGRKKRRRKRRKPRPDRCGCGPGQLCDGDDCLPCDVCANGCTYDSITAAITDAAGPDTIRVCSGSWTVPDSVVIDRDRTIIGAGSGAGGTVLVGAGSGDPSVVIQVVDHYLEMRRLGVSHLILNAGGLFVIAVALVAIPSFYGSGTTMLFSEGVSSDGPVVVASTTGD